MRVRPTSSRVRQAVFSALSGRVAGSCVLDLYAGTGAMGVEALSRGAAAAVFVELSSKCAGTIKENLELTGLSQRARVIRGDALRVLRQLGRQKRKFDIVILDPPYEAKKGMKGERSLAGKTLKALVESDILRANSLVIVEHRESGAGLEIAHGLKLVAAKKYGETAVSTFCLTKDA